MLQSFRGRTSIIIAAERQQQQQLHVRRTNCERGNIVSANTMAYIHTHAHTITVDGFNLKPAIDVPIFSFIQHKFKFFHDSVHDSVFFSYPSAMPNGSIQLFSPEYFSNNLNKRKILTRTKFGKEIELKCRKKVIWALTVSSGGGCSSLTHPPRTFVNQ